MFATSHETLIWARKTKIAKHYFDYSLMKEGNWSNDIIKKDNKQMRSVWAINTPHSNKKIRKTPYTKAHFINEQNNSFF